MELAEPLTGGQLGGQVPRGIPLEDRVRAPWGLPAHAGCQQALVGGVLDDRVLHEPAEVEPAGTVAAGLDVAELAQGIELAELGFIPLKPSK